MTNEPLDNTTYKGYNKVELTPRFLAKYGDTVFVDLYEIWHRVGYKIPYARWASYTVKNYNLRCHVIKFRNGKPGPPVMHYYSELSNALDFLGAIERKRHVRLILKGVVNGEISNQVKHQGNSDGELLRPTGSKEGGLRLVRD